MFVFSTLLWLSGASISLGSPAYHSNSARRDTTSACDGNTADDRSTWCDYDLTTNYYDDGPDTGVTREYWFELTNITAAPDGVSRDVLTVNGTIPGPTILADWGDTVIVYVSNALENNGTSLHFHGVRQNYTNSYDGVSAITQCPTAPGDTVTYQWKASQYGSSWYHSHFALQAWEGVFGGIVINGPAAASYDVDLGNLFLNDWDHDTVDALYSYALTSGPPTLDTGLINGTNTWDDTEGSYFETNFTSGDSYLIRLVNAAIDTHFSFTIDNHTMQVIAMDFVPIVPYTTDVLSIGMGQRYDVVVKANMSAVASDFWLRAIPDAYCSDNDNVDGIKGIVHYDGSTDTPSTTAHTVNSTDCTGEPYASQVPYLSLDAASSASVVTDEDITVSDQNTNDWFLWYVGGSTFKTFWDDPTALQVLNNETSFNDSMNVIRLPTADEWAYLVIQADNAVPHPIHLHGHDFYVLAEGTGNYTTLQPTLQTSNPPRRDVAMLPGSGYLVIAFQADNPGVWLCHCHIGWHTDEGFDLQFVERYDEIAALYNSTKLEDACSTWSTYQTSASLVQEDSGV